MKANFFSNFPEPNRRFERSTPWKLDARDSVKREHAAGTTEPKLMATKLFSWPSLFSSADEAAMWRVRSHDDADAFARLVARWQGPIRTLCARMTGDVHRGEDLAQETFVRLYARRALYEPTGKFSTFLWRMALNICFEPPDSRPMDVLPLR